VISLCDLPLFVLALLAANNLKGTLPPELGLLDELVELDLHNNRLEGQLSSDLSRLQKLTHLDLSLNNFQGPMPELKRMTQLLYLSLAENKFDEGPVPEDWSNLVNLKELSLMDTSRTGPIPNFFGFSGRQLTQLDLSNNQLTGYIPRSLNKLSNLREFPIRRSWNVFC
jgi:Leucine-rich repeat (LRR) protein